MSEMEPTHVKLLSLQRRIYRSLQAEAARLMGETPDSIVKYEKAYKEDFRSCIKRVSLSNKVALIKAIREADVTFVADFHTFAQAQRTALRLMRDAVKPGEKWYIGIELVPSQCQPDLDDFQAGKISLDVFQKRINYAEEWGFPWSHYAPIFDWANQQGIRLIALNRPKGMSALISRQRDSELEERDRWGAGIITDLFEKTPKTKGPRPKMIVLYGELHLAPCHLPEQLKQVSKSHLGRALKSLIVHQNNDRLYWKLAQSNKTHHSNVLKLQRNSYCVISGTPWGKLQSLVSWADGEKETVKRIAEEEDFEDASDFDYLSTMQTYGTAIAELLNAKVPSYEDLTVRTIEGADFVELLESTDHFRARELQLIRAHVENNLRLYIPRANIAYLGTPSENRAAELAAIHLQRILSRAQEIFEPKTDDFYRLVIESTFGFFGSLILNPRRKCDLPHDHERRIESLKRGAHEETQGETLARKVSLNVFKSEAALLKGGNLKAASLGDVFGSRRMTPAATLAIMLAARYVGNVLGKKMHHALIKGVIQSDDVKRICLARVDGAHRMFEDKYVELVRSVGPIHPDLEPSKSAVI